MQLINYITSSFKSFVSLFLKREIQSLSLKLKAIRATAWIALGSGLQNILRLISNLTLAYLLFPEAFGIMAIARTSVEMLVLFSDLGVKTAIIQKPEGNSKEYLDTSWIFSIGRGGILFIISILIAYPLSFFFNQPNLAPIFICISASVLIRSFENPAIALFTKEFRAEKRVVYLLIPAFFGLLTTIVLAYFFRSVWALVAGTVISAVYHLIMSYVMHPYRPSFIWNNQAAGSIFHFGKYMFLNTMISWAAMNIDNFFIGKFFGMKILGFYSIGKTLGVSIERLLLTISTQAYFPAISAVQNNLKRVCNIYTKTVKVTIAFVIPVLIILALFSNEIISILYREEYLAVSIAFFWLSFRGIFRMLSLIQSSTIIGLGKPAFETVSMGVGLVALVIFLPTFSYFGETISKFFEPIFHLMTAQFKFYGSCFGIFLSGITITAMETFLLVYYLKFPAKTMIQTWLHILCLILISFGLYLLLKNIEFLNFFYGIPSLLVFGILLLSLSAFIYFYLNKKTLKNNLIV